MKTYDRQDVMDLMRAAGYETARVDFSGGGDEGGADTIIVSNAHSATELDPYDDSSPLSMALSNMPHWKYYSFADDGRFHVSGTIRVDVLEDTITFECEESHESYETFEEEY